MIKFIRKVQAKLFKHIKNKKIKAVIASLFSMVIIDNKNRIIYDSILDNYWLKRNLLYLLAFDKPDFEFNKKQFYANIETIFCFNYYPKKGDVIVDIGAGIGTETCFFIEKIGVEGKLYSIEASNESFKKLTYLKNKNNFSNVFNHNLAISNKNGSIWMEETDNYVVNKVNNEAKGIKLNSSTFDEFVSNNHISNINFLKVNIEGSEYDMVDGMKKSVKIVKNMAISCHDFLFTDDKRIETKVVNFLKENNFEVYFKNTGNKILDSWIYAENKNFEDAIN